MGGRKLLAEEKHREDGDEHDAQFVDRRDLRRVIEGNQAPDWPAAPSWESLTQTITS